MIATRALVAALPGATLAPELPPADWSFLFGDLRTGRITGELPIASPSFTAPLNDAGTFTGELHLDDDRLDGLNLYDSLAPGRSFLAVDLDGQLVYGGPVWSHRYSTSSRVLRVAGAGLWSVFDHRKIIPALALATPADEAADTVYANLTLAGIARRLIAQAFAHTGGDLPLVQADGTPITLDPGTEAGTAARTYNGYDLTWLGDALRDLTNVEAGPDMEFRPERDPARPNYVRWRHRLGTPHLAAPGAPWRLEADVDVVDVVVDRDGTGLGGRAWVTGDGTQRQRLIAHADDLALVFAQGAPLLEVEDSHYTVSDPATVASYAAGLATLRSGPVESWAVTVRTDTDLRPGTYAVGDYFTVPVDGDPYLPAGDHVARCLSIGGDGRYLTLTMEPQTGAL